MSEYEHLSVRYEAGEADDSIAIATVLTPEFRSEDPGRELGKELIDLLGSKPKALVVNFSRVNFLTSSSIGQIVKVWKQSLADNCPLVLTELSDVLAELFRIVRLDGEIEIVSPEQRAIAAVCSDAE